MWKTWQLLYKGSLPEPLAKLNADKETAREKMWTREKSVARWCKRIWKKKRNSKQNKLLQTFLGEKIKEYLDFLISMVTCDETVSVWRRDWKSVNERWIEINSLSKTNKRKNAKIQTHDNACCFPQY